MSFFRYNIITLIVLLMACEKPVIDEPSVSKASDADGNVTLTFAATSADISRSNPLNVYISRLNVQLFNAQGVKVFDKVRTQTSNDSDFGSLSLQLAPGSYTVVAVGHSSKNAASINSPQDVRFTSSNGEKLTDTFCHCSEIVVPDASSSGYSLPMYRVGAMIQFSLEDVAVPSAFTYFKMEYTGGSANFSPTTFCGITKSSQSEQRLRNEMNLYQCYTFPYLAYSGTLKMTCTAIDSYGKILRQRTFDNVPVSRNRITTYRGPFFEDGDGEFTLSDFSFVIHADWEGDTLIHY